MTATRQQRTPDTKEPSHSGRHFRLSNGKPMCGYGVGSRWYFANNYAQTTCEACRDEMRKRGAGIR